MRHLTYDEQMLVGEIRILLAKVTDKPAWVVAAAYDKFAWDAVLTEPIRVRNVSDWLDRKEKYPATE